MTAHESPRTFGDLLKMRGPYTNAPNHCQFCRKAGYQVEGRELWKYSTRHYVCGPCIGGRPLVVLPAIVRHEAFQRRMAAIATAEAPSTRAPAISGEAFSGRIVKAVLPLFAIALLMHLGGCATAAPAAAPLTPPSCSSDRQCAAMWAAARDWVASSCGMKIQTITDGFIETYGPLEGNAACRIWRDPNPAGGFTFHARINFAGPWMDKTIRQMLAGLVDVLNSTGAAFR